MKIAAVAFKYRRGLARGSGDDVFDRIDYTSPPRTPRRRRRRPEEEVGNPSTIFPQAPTVTDYVSERNPYGTAYVQALIERIDSGKYPHELDDRRNPAAADADDELVMAEDKR